jgi:serine/threonine protein kinase
VDDGAGAGQEQLLQSTSSTSAAAQPQARPNNTAKSTDPAGQTISEAELEGRFKVIRYLGKGSYGTVFVAEELATGKQVAIKKIPKVRQTNTHTSWIRMREKKQQRRKVCEVHSMADLFFGVSVVFFVHLI